MSITAESRVVGRYAHVEVDDVEYRTYYEEGGSGIPLVCLHTAGTDSRQFRFQLEDQKIGQDFRVVAFDLPWHGRSMPPEGWQLMREEYRLTSDFYTKFVMAFCDSIGAEQPVIMGSSMGGNVCLPLADRYGDRIRALIPLEAADRSHGWVSNALWDPRCHGAEVAASYVMGEIAPMSPQARRWDIWWFYATGAPGVFKGDVFFYSDDHDYRERVAAMQSTPPMYFMTGEYDGACKPAMSKATADRIANAAFLEMKGIGHFPMSENPELFKKYLEPVLEHIKTGESRIAGFSWD